MIGVRFTNGTQLIDLKHVRSVEWSTQISDDALVSGTTRVGARRRKIVVKGFINKAQFTNNLLAQQQLESELIAVGTGTIEYGGGNNITEVRFKALSFSEFRGNPVADFSAEFSTEESNVHTHDPVGVGALTLSPANGYEYVSVDDNIGTQGPDEQLVGSLNRSFSITGTFIGTTIAEVNTSQAALVAAIENLTTVVLTLSAAVSTFAGSYTVRPGSLKFGVPRLKDNQTARSFSFECKTFEDYTKEPYTLGEVAQAFANIELDVVENVNQKRTNDKVNAGSVYHITAEEMTVTGKKYFVDFTAYTAFRDVFNPVPPGTYTIASTTQNVLELQDFTTSKFGRDGNYANGDKRYSASISMSFRWDVGVEGRVVEHDANHFGINWFKIESANFSSTVDETGNLTSSGVNISGKLVGAANAALALSLLGQKADYDASLPDMYITSVSMTALETQNFSGVQTEVYTISMSGRQLDTASKAAYFVQGLFSMSKAGAGAATSYSADTIQFDKISSLSKSFSNRFDQQTTKFKITSVNLSVSGEVWSADNGSGAPLFADRTTDLFNKLDALLSSSVSDPLVGLTVAAGEVLPNNAAVHFLLTSFSVGEWQTFVKQGGVGAGDRYWKQTVSISATAVFDLSAGSSSTQPDFVDTVSVAFTDESPKYQQLQVVGFGTVFKRVGTNPAKEVATSQRQYRDQATLEFGSFPADPPGPAGFTLSQSVLTKSSQETRGTTKRIIKEWSATEKIS